MSQYDDKGKGALFPVREKRSENGPDFTGYFVADEAIQPGQRIQVAAWTRSKGVVSMSRDHRAEEKMEQSQGGSRIGTRPGADQSAAPDFDDDSIPF